MADWPAAAGGNRFEIIGWDDVNDQGTQVTTPSTAHTKSGWVQLAAATAFDAAGLWIIPTDLAANYRWLIDIGVGGSGSEHVLVPDQVHRHYWTEAASVNRSFWPIRIPAGSRVSFRAQCEFASRTGRVHALLAGQAQQQPLSRVDALGVVSASTDGTALGDADTWTEIAASTDRAYKALSFAVRHYNTVTKKAAYDIGVGGSGSEQVLIPKLAQFLVSLHRVPLNTLWGPLPVNIPAGTRLSIRGNLTEADDAAILYGMG